MDEQVDLRRKHPYATIQVNDNGLHSVQGYFDTALFEKFMKIFQSAYTIPPADIRQLEVKCYRKFNRIFAGTGYDPRTKKIYTPILEGIKSLGVK